MLLVELAREESEIQTQITLAEESFSADQTSLQASLTRMHQESISLQNQIAEQERRIQIANDLLRRFEDLRNEDAASHMEVERQRESVTAQRQAKEALRQRFQSLTREYQLQEDRLNKLPLEKGLTVSQLRARLSALSQRKTELSSRGQQVITAPVTGTIATLGAKSGSSIDSNKVLAEILPSGSTLFAEVYVPSRAIGFVEEGKPVRLMYEAFPHQRFGSGEGSVSKVTNTVLRPEEIPTPLRMEESAYKARVALNGQSMEAFGREFPLRPGMALRAEIILEERTFLQWLLEPIMARRGWQSSAEAS
ncbi:MAG: HlyD family efflux transporter periplasmic adaptor subunit [Thiotrichales bacterium]